jgi:hypothetical protein
LKINIEIVLLRTRSKENTFEENPFYSRRERVLCKIYERDSGRPATSSGRPATSRAAQQILSAVERCVKLRAAMAAKKMSVAAEGGRDPGAAATSRKATNCRYKGYDSNPAISAEVAAKRERKS